MRPFDSLSEREILALAIAAEEEDGRVYGDFAEGLRENFPATAELFRKMQVEEIEHRGRLYDRYREKFGEHIPLIRRQDVRGFLSRRPVWLIKPLGLNAVRKAAASMEAESRAFYLKAAQRSTDAGVRQLLTELADAEQSHESAANRIEEKVITADVRVKEDETKRRLFVLQVVQPGLAGLMDGSVSTLAPLFAAAFASARQSHPDHWFPFKVGLAASIGAGISMGFAEALSDDGILTGRGRPWTRGVVCGAMTALGGLGHTMPYLIPDLKVATTVAIIVVMIELALISWIRHRFMSTPWVAAAIQIVLGGILVFLTGYAIGSS
ncbi:MAG TPA: ferritin family protein [Tepidisphaeraceae bacterium]|nr:ferritin family protein [Tepidisphaeraceae bacterium]